MPRLVSGGGAGPATAAGGASAAVVLGGAALLVGWQLLRARRRTTSLGGAGPTRVVVLGLGFCGGAVARRLAREGRCEVLGTTRGQEDRRNGQAGVRTLVTGGGTGESGVTLELAKALASAEVVIATAPPSGESGDPFLADERLRSAVCNAGASGALVIYLSSVGVYGDTKGALVTEETPPAPRTARAKRRLAAEEAWRQLPLRQLAIVRLPGIYGAGRGPLAKAREGNALIVKEGHVFSRIHVEDVVRLCCVLVEAQRRNGGGGGGGGGGAAWDGCSDGISVINCCDSEPAPQHEVSALAYQLLGRQPPPPVAFESAELSDMQRSFYEESRRMGNEKLLKVVGTLAYPSYRTGLQACLEEEVRQVAARRQWLRAPLRFAAGALESARVGLACLSRSSALIRVALIDNGSLRAEATLSLRRLAAEVEAQASAQGRRLRVDAVSARFSDRIPARELEGRPAETLPGWLTRVAAEGELARGGKVLLLPLLIGPSNTLTKSVPSAVRALPELAASDVVEVAPTLVCLCPFLYAPEASGAGELSGMLSDRLAELAVDGQRWDGANDHVLLCDHGSPIARVTAAREAVRSHLERRLGRSVQSCCMERREGPEYDFNGPLLEEALMQMPANSRVGVALLFLQNGKHAGPGGDIAGIVAGVAEKRPDLTVQTTQVLAGHPALVELLVQRLDKAVPLRLLP